MKAKQFFSELNIMRGMAVLCVVIGHSFDPTIEPTILGFLKGFVYCFHMPAFFFISGFLVKEQNLSLGNKIAKVKHKAERLMVPYLFLTVVTVGLKIVFGVFARNPLNYNTLVVDVLVGRNNPNGGLWFLYALFVISITGILVSGIDLKVLFVISVLLYFLNTLVLHQSGYVLGFFMTYAMYYFGGAVFRKYCYTKIVKSKLVISMQCKISILVSTILLIMLAFIYVYYVNYWLLSTIITVGSIIVLYFWALIVDLGNKGKRIWMTLGEYGMDIYMIGYYVQQSIYVVLGKFLHLDYYVYAWCMLVAGAILPILISKYIVRNNKLLSKLILGR